MAWMEDFRNYTDRKLIALLQQGSKEAMTEIYERHWGPMLSHAYRMLKDDARSKDVLQDVFLSLWHRAGKLRDDTSLPAYLHTLVRNRVLNELAREKVRSDHLESFTRFIEQKPDPADEIYIEKELTEEIERALSQMPARMREVYELSRKQCLSHEEISQQLQISTATVKRHINKVLNRLRHYLGGWLFFYFF